MTTEDSGIPAATAGGSLTNFTDIRAEHDAANTAMGIADTALDEAREKIGYQNCPRWGLTTVQTEKGPALWGQSEIEHAAAEGECYGANTTPEECARALAELERLERDGRAEEDRLGLTPIREATCAKRAEEIERRIIATNLWGCSRHFLAEQTGWDPFAVYGRDGGPRPFSEDEIEEAATLYPKETGASAAAQANGTGQEGGAK